MTGEPLTQRDDDNVVRHEECRGILADTSQETFKNRLETYKNKTEPLLDYYQTNGARLQTLNGKTSDEIWPKLDALLKEKYTL